MLGWIFGKKRRKFEEETKKGFSAVKEDMDAVGKWIKHLDKKNKQVFEVVSTLKNDLSRVRGELNELSECLDLLNEGVENKQLSKKPLVLNKQPGVEGVEKAVQTAVQTGNLFDILKGLSSNEKLLFFTLMNSELKLSYEDLALLLGKEKSTIRGQLNSIRQKCEGKFLEEIIEKNGKKRVYIPNYIKEKLAKYAKVRVKDKKKLKIEENQ